MVVRQPDLSSRLTFLLGAKECLAMDRFAVTGGRPLQGSVEAASAKNSVLPILAACILTEEPCTIDAVPQLEDVATMLRLLQSMGIRVSSTGRTVTVEASGKPASEAPYDIVRKMRAGYYVLGPLLGRCGRAKVSLPGGCAIGARPVDLHLKGARALGAAIDIEHGYIDARATGMRGATMVLEGTNGPSVGATINTMMAAVLTQGETVIQGAAAEPEVADVAGFLCSMGAVVEGAGTPLVRIHGVKKLHGTSYRPVPDRIEVGTLAVAAALTRGQVEITGCRPDHLAAPIEVLRHAGAEVETGPDRLMVKAKDRPRPFNITTAPYPGFPTDLQAQFMTLASLAEGTSTIEENIFEARFMHAMELDRMGARIAVKGSVAVVTGVERLSAAQVMASDLRASAALVLAGLACEGTTEILRIYHLDRGYEKLEEKLATLGARVERVRK